MRKHLEVKEPTSCLNRADDNELLFVLRGRDVAAPGAIRVWCAKRVLMKKNTWGDPQIVEALNVADAMELERVP
jgi:hypothetical protein